MSPSFKIQKIKKLAGYTVEWVDENGYILSKRNKLYSSKKLSEPLNFIGAFPASFYKTMLSKSRIVQRALRFLFYNVIKVKEDRIFVTFQKNVAIFSQNKFELITGLKRPARFLRGGCAVDKNGGIYLGEYFSNPHREEVNIYYLAPNSNELKIVYTFCKGSIRHIHGLYFDPFEGHLWVVTGDFPHECQILRTNDGFKTIEIIGQGDESWRTISIMFKKDAFYYATDAEFQQNHVFKIDRLTMKRSLLFDVDGPVYYTQTTSDYLFIGVTAEGCKSQVNKCAYLWALDNDDRPTLITQYKKDFLPIHFMPGTFHFPLGNNPYRSIYIHCLGLNNVDDQLLELTY